MHKEKLPLYQNSRNRREWIHVLDHCVAIDRVITKGRIGETYNIGTGYEADIDTIADFILKELQLDASYKTYVPDRPSHDRRYLLDSTKIEKELGWRPSIDVEKGMRETIHWYRDNEWWWQPLLSRLVIQENSWKK
jgi:dTDP-glucose 4,6-dehydratase